MSKAMEDMCEEAVERDRIDRTRSLLRIGKLTLEEISEVMQLSIEKVKEIAKGMREVRC